MQDYLKTFLAFDTETTGVDSDARIVDLAAVLFTDGQPIMCWSTLINPGDIDWDLLSVQQALEVNGLTRDDLVNAPTFPEVWSTFMAICSWANDTYCAHNGQFDLRMLDQELDRIGSSWRCFFASRPCPTRTIDTMLADFVHRPGYFKRRLDVASAAWKVPQESAHRAMSDALTCGRLLVAMADRMPPTMGAWMKRQEEAAREWDTICQRAAMRASARA